MIMVCLLSQAIEFLPILMQNKLNKMESSNIYIYTPLPEPLPITEQQWPEGTLPLVATNTSTFNQISYIRDCIEGILIQKTTFPVRLVIFDDCSTDGTREIVQEYEAKYPHLIKGFYPKENTWGKPERKEALKPRNEARNIAKYIAICEGDDYWTDPLKLQKQVDFLEKNPEYSACFHNAEVIYENNEKKSHPFTILNENTFSIEDIIERSWFIPTQSIVYRFTSFERSSWTNYIYNGDYAIQLLLANKGFFYYINEKMSVYRRNPQSISRKQKAGFAQIKIIEILCFFNLYTDFKYDALIKKRINTIHKSLYKTLLYGRPFFNKYLSIDFYLFKFHSWLRKI